ncbi:ABC transporter substrate-binding protein [Actinotalea sp. C106]|uniref:ABC transporter substrate-binding protein n=1 Tax=Actinotalea sp. C106 TaxID=2908644 RepID=UPI00202787D4|nr:ABC transporter substrate-binding protein [Actinotalea sp. C106]
MRRARPAQSVRPTSPARAGGVVLAAATALVLAGCSSETTEDDAAAPAPEATEAECEPGSLPTLTDEVLTVGAGEPYLPWYTDEYESGEGFESALIYAVAAELGYQAEDVQWETVTFEQIISPAVKPFDVAAYQTSITDERRAAVDFSSPYLTTRQGVIVMQDGPYADASTIADLEGARIGVTAAQTSLTLSEAAFGEDADISPYSAAGDGMQALQSGTIDAMVMDVDQGVAASTEYFPDSMVIGTLPDEGVVEQYGLVLDVDSELTTCVSQAVDSLEEDGTLGELRTTWLKSDDIPVLE